MLEEPKIDVINKITDKNKLNELISFSKNKVNDTLDALKSLPAGKPEPGIMSNLIFYKEYLAILENRLQSLDTDGFHDWLDNL